MSSKFWVCIALLSVGIAHTYMYTDFFTYSEVQEVTGIAGYVSGFLPHMEWTKERHKFELKTMLEVGQQMVEIARKGIAKYRAQREQEKTKRSNNMAYKSG